MSTEIMKPMPGTDPGIADIESILSDLELDGDIEDGVVIEDVGELDAASEAAITAAVAIDEAYKDQPVTASDVVAPPSPALPAVAAKAPEAAEKVAKERKTRVAKTRDLSALAPSTFVLTNDPDFDRTETDLDLIKTNVLARRPAQKKIADKFDNLFQSIAAGSKPSVYVMACFAVLAAKKTITQSDLVVALKATSSKKGAGYSEGTARSQAGQIMVLFDLVGIATRVKQSLTLNPMSRVANVLKTMMAS